ncbi:helix-turn-helix domain-containing protein [Tenacibaculum dicentrarchi]|nr:helix-turn-helix domain-containing protein [Tenacibaculum dicentrarchi]
MNNPFAQIDARLSNIENLILSLNQTPTNQPQELEEPINIKEVAKLTELSVPTLYGYVQRNEVPYYKKGNRLKFFKSEIIDWLKEGKVKTVSEIEADADAYLSNNKKGLK